jgi:aspartate-semialdehyde dehydrogenase
MTQPDDTRAAQPNDSGAVHLGEAGGRAGGDPEGEARRRAGGRQPDDTRAARNGEAGRRAGGRRVAVVGATGAVGRTMLELLKERDFPADELTLFASARSAGQEIDGRIVQLLDDRADLDGFDIALFSAGAGTSRTWAPRFAQRGTAVIDNSSAFRRDPEVPLVVSEVNPHALRAHQGLIANPNCSTMQLMVALAPIHRAVGLERVIVSTYQSVSGTGREAVSELDAQVRASLDGEPLPEPRIYPDHIGFNVIGAAGTFPDGDDHTDEERKMMFETRKILEDDDIGIAVTCVRVPVRVCHSESVNLQTREPISPERVRELLGQAPGLILEDVPSPLRAEGRDEVFVGRIRRDESHPRALSMWVVSDNLRKGAATNAVQIAELLVADGSGSAATGDRTGAPVG